MSDAVLLLRAAASWLAALVTVGTAMALRADSDGPTPSRSALLLAIVVLAVAFWPMTSGRRRWRAFGLALVGLQVTTHAFLLYAATGQLAHSGASGLFCCPSTSVGAHAGALATLTANAGWMLLLVQLVVVATLAVPLRLVHKVFLNLGLALAAVVRAAVPLLAGLFATTVPPSMKGQRPRAPRHLGRSGRQATGAVRRRGPPLVGLVRSSFVPLSVTGKACAA